MLKNSLLYFLISFFSFYLLFFEREVAEWSKAHAWKVCIHQKCIEGSNPFLSAEYVICVIKFHIFNTPKIKKQNNEEISMFNWDVFNVIHPFQL